MSIEFIENIESLNIFDYSCIKKWLDESIVNEGFSVGTLTFVIMSDEDLLDYNRKFLSHDYYTDVITFDDSNGKEISGDVLISWDRINDNAKTMNVGYLNEFLRVVIHGVLHLCGYKDKLEEDIKIMRKKESFYLDRIDEDSIVSRETFG
ncbi:rRNA maturation RNase YbeY [bacterium SCSIO 12643]|nr:rRNA maturation RNase YbeY [bacterium SCSIO 12643]